MTFNELNAVKLKQPSANWAKARKFWCFVIPKLKHGVSVLFPKFDLRIILLKHRASKRTLTLPIRLESISKFMDLQAHALLFGIESLTLPFRVGVKYSPKNRALAQLG